MIIRESKPAWAIACEMRPGYPSYLGVYYFAAQRGQAQTGCVWALFATRREAREAFAARFQGSEAFARKNRFRVVRVNVELVREERQ